MALRELGACRELLDQNGVPREHSDFSCVPVDHADVLAEHIDEDEDNTIDDKTGPVEPADDLGLPVRTVVEDTLARPPSTGDLEPLGDADETSPSQVAASEEVGSGHQHGAASTASAAYTTSAASAAIATGFAADLGMPSSSLPVASSSGDFTGDGTAMEQALANASREKERLEVELSMAKALLMLNNVNINMDFDQEDAPAASAAEVVNLKGSRHLIKLLLTLKQKVSLLNQQYLLLRGDMLYMNHEMNVCRHWILQSFRMAVQHQSQEHSSLQTRFERLSKVLP